MKHILPFLILIIIFSCRKDSREYNINGHILDKYSNKSFNLNIPICASNDLLGTNPIAETKTDLSGYYQLSFKGERNLLGYHIYAGNFYPLTFKDSSPYGVVIHIYKGNSVVNILGTCRVENKIIFVRDSSDLIDSIILKTITPVDTLVEYLNSYGDYEFFKNLHLYATNKNYLFVYFIKNGNHFMLTDTIIPLCTNDEQTDTIKF